MRHVGRVRVSLHNIRLGMEDTAGKGGCQVANSYGVVYPDNSTYYGRSLHSRDDRFLFQNEIPIVRAWHPTERARFFKRNGVVFMVFSTLLDKGKGFRERRKKSGKTLFDAIAKLKVGKRF